MPFWCARLDQRKQSLALHLLRLNEYEIYLPLIAARKGGDPVALFPSYLFVRCAARGWWGVRWSPGIVAMVRGAGEEPAVLGDQIVDELKARENRHGFVVLPKPSRLNNNNGGAKFQIGDKVRVGVGPLSGFTELVQNLKPHQRLEILLAALGRVELSQAAVELV